MHFAISSFPKLALAPMAGVTDLAFRRVCRDEGASFTVTEMVSAKALVFGDQKSRRLLLLDEGESPAAVQIFGSEPDTMAEAANIAAELSGCACIDINMGCPTPKIVKNGDGAALMRDLTLAEAIISAVARAVSLPVGVKFRKGWDKPSANAVEFARMAERAGASYLTVHGRTKGQMYAGQADWDIIRDVKRAVSIPVVANGDIVGPAEAIRALSVTGADAVMVGRASFGNPWVFRDIAAALAGEDIPAPPSIDERCDMALKQFSLMREYKSDHIVCLEARKHYAWYLRGVPHAGYYKEEISKIQTLEDIETVTKRIRRDLTV